METNTSKGDKEKLQIEIIMQVRILIHKCVTTLVNLEQSMSFSQSCITKCTVFLSACHNIFLEKKMFFNVRLVTLRVRYTGNTQNIPHAAEAWNDDLEKYSASFCNLYKLILIQ